MGNNKILSNKGTVDFSIQDITDEIERIEKVADSKLALTPENADSGIAKLVLTLVELIRKLVEKQAMRRVDGGTLTDAEIERLGETLMKGRDKTHERSN